VGTHKPRRFTAVTAAIAAIAMTGATLAVGLGFGRAEAKPPPKPGPVTGLQMTLTKPADNFLVEATWNAATNATTYDVALSDATTGAPLAGNSVAITSWSTMVNLTGVTTVRLTVTPKNQRPGTPTSITQDVPDINAPFGTYTVSWVDLTGTITQTSLNDDGPIGEVTRTVDWGDATTPEAWTTGDTIDHLYAAEGLYRPTVTLEDGVGNTRVVVLDPIVPGDVTAPTGTFTTAPSTAWQQLTTVNVIQTALSDDFSAAADVDRWISWGDGGEPQAWAQTISLAHVYATAGTYTPQVILKDEAGNTGAVDAQPVTVKADIVAPVVRITLPNRAVRADVSAWRQVHGKATDTNGTGVDTVSVRAIEKRGTAWYFYKSTTKTWVKAATRGRAWQRSKPVVVHPAATGAWAARLAGLKKGTLLVRASATDLAGNTSRAITQKAVLSAW
jgi:hypothetical protein